MKNIQALLVSLAIAGTCITSASAATTSLTVMLTAQNGSGENGSASLTQTGSDLTVVISIPKGPAGPQPVHIHMGTCTDLGGVANGLTPVTNGASTSVVKGVTIDQLLAAKFAINVHKSTSDLGTYVSCGNIVKSSAM